MMARMMRRATAVLGPEGAMALETALAETQVTTLEEDLGVFSRYVPASRTIEVSLPVWRHLSKKQRKEKSVQVLHQYLLIAGQSDESFQISRRLVDDNGTQQGFEQQTRAKGEFALEALDFLIQSKYRWTFGDTSCWLLFFVKCGYGVSTPDGRELKVGVRWNGSVVIQSWVVLRSPKYIRFDRDGWTAPGFDSDVERVVVTATEQRLGARCEVESSNAEKKVYACALADGKSEKLEFELEGGLISKVAF